MRIVVAAVDRILRTRISRTRPLATAKRCPSIWREITPGSDHPSPEGVRSTIRGLVANGHDRHRKDALHAMRQKETSSLLGMGAPSSVRSPRDRRWMRGANVSGFVISGCGNRLPTVLGPRGRASLTTWTPRQFKLRPSAQLHGYPQPVHEIVDESRVDGPWARDQGIQVCSGRVPRMVRLRVIALNITSSLSPPTPRVPP